MVSGSTWYKDLLIYDLKQEHPTWVKTAFFNSLNDIANSNHALKNNYKSLRALKFNDMISFIVVIDPVDKDIICFGGVQAFINNTARINSRHYFSDKYTKKYYLKHLNWKICVPPQIQKSIHAGYTELFFSTEAELFKNNRWWIRQCYNATKSINLPNIKIIPLDGFYDVTGHKSWQRVGQVIINNISWETKLIKKDL